jgi:ABC-type multidrug transport system fused ATPase/permease subunit
MFKDNQISQQGYIKDMGVGSSELDELLHEDDVFSQKTNKITKL